jgi:hypothetical protein
VLGFDRFHSALGRSDPIDSKIDVLLRPLGLLHAADMICHLWQQYVNIALFPLGNSSVAIRREMTVFNSQNVSRIEGAANQVVQRVIDSETPFMVDYRKPDSYLKTWCRGWRSRYQSRSGRTSSPATTTRCSRG